MIQPALLHADVSDLLQRMRAGRLGPLQIMEHYLAAARRDSHLHAFVEIFTEEAIAAALAAQERWQARTPQGPLDGIPIAVKNNIDVRGKLSRAGSAAPPWGNAASTATTVERLQRAGAIVLGTTHCVELALGGWGTNEWMGTPRNPWSSQSFRVSGGSSSGSAVAVAAGSAPCALGTDTGGSIRTPAAWCGLTGLKVSSGTLPADGVVPLSPTLDTVGLLCLSARDATLLFDVMRNAGPVTRSSHEAGTRPQNVEPGSLRLARLHDSELRNAQSEISDAYEESLTVFRRLGADIVCPGLPCSLEQAIQDSNAILAHEAYSHWRHLVEDMTYPMDGAVRARIVAGRGVSQERYARALDNRKRLSNEIRAWFQDIDALLMPTVTMMAPALDAIDETASPSHYSRYANFLDLPALALPCGYSEEHSLPLSWQIVGPSGGEARILEIGRIFQAHTDWHLKRPPGAVMPPN